MAEGSRSRRSSLFAAFALAGCYVGASADEADDPMATVGADSSSAGDDGADGGDDGDAAQRLPGECAEPSGPPVPLRRLTRAQYNNTVADLLSDTTSPADSFTQDERVGAFATNSIAAVSGLAVEQYMNAAEELATTAVADLDALLPCSVTAMGEDECAAEFIADFGLRAYRRPLDPDELARAQALFESGRSAASFADGIRLVVQAMLQSPHFLYHFEQGIDADGEVVALTPYEVASRLSYFIWGSMPDDELFAAAANGELVGEQDVETQAWRLLASDKASAGLGSFHRQWLDVEGLDALEKDAAMFEQWGPELARSMKEEAARFGSHVIRNDDGSLLTLLTASYTIADARLAALYGVAPPSEVDEDGFGLVELPPGQRAGLLTQAGWLAGHAHSNQTSPVFRGKLVREQMLCQPLPQPPDTVDDTPPAIDPDATAKERFEQLLEDPVCAACHIQMNPIGFGFEHYDAIGAYREMDGNVAVDAVGELVATDVDGTFDGALDLASRLSQSEMAQECFARQWMRFATGRIETEQDACAEAEIMAAFERSDQNIAELIVAVAGSDMMRFIRRQ